MIDLDEGLDPVWPWWLLLALLLTTALACGSSEYSTTLTGQYQLIKSHGYGISVWQRGRDEFVPPDIVDFAMLQDRYLVGRLQPPEEMSVHAPDRSGWFIADTKTGQVQLQMTEAQWRAALAAHGLETDLHVNGIPWRYNTSPGATMIRSFGWIVVATVVLMAVVTWVLKRSVPKMAPRKPAD